MDIIKNKFKTITVFLAILLSNSIFSQNEYKTINDIKGLSVGSIVTDFSATDQNNKQFILSDALNNSIVIVMFYRGEWCPVCNKYLSNLQDSLQMVYDKGAIIVAISPENSEYSHKTAEKTKATFSLLYDKGYKISKQFDVLYLPKASTRIVYNTMLGAKLKKSHSDNTQQLPLPATFIIDKSGKIIWKQFNTDIHIRATAKQLLNVLN